jgi:predicted metalloprotease with PDZ domain
LLDVARRAPASALLALLAVTTAAEEGRVSYRLSFPEAEQRWMQVEVRFEGLASAPLDVRMSRSSPGRYALHEFVKNVYAVEVRNGAGQVLEPERPDRHGWRVAVHDGTVVFRYRVYGDRVDGTYLGIDATHAHVNAPAALVWARGLESRPVELQLEPPPGSGWKVATQLRPTADPFRFEAPNLHYLMDSPIEASRHLSAEFTLPARADGSGGERRFRIALHHEGGREELEEMLEATRRIAREQRAVFGELPAFDGVGYTFLADYLPWASGDGMEHRNSTVLTSTRSLADPDGFAQLLGTVSHELFHAWNVERLRPASLEPFDYEDANVSGDLWFAEGFTSYYGALVLQRAGVVGLEATLEGFAEALDAVINGPGRELRSAVEMSRLAPFVDSAAVVDRTDWGNTYISYYTWGQVLALGLDLSLRVRGAGEPSLDDLMRALWERHGRAPAPDPGLVSDPWTPADIEAALADLTRDPEFARSYMARFVEGREVPDYAALLDRAGLVLRPRFPERAWLGAQLEPEGETARVASPVVRGGPAHRAGLAEDDVVVTLGGAAPAARGGVAGLLRRHAPGDALELRYLRRGRLVEGELRLGVDPALELVTAEAASGEGPDAERLAFRDSWLGSRAGS